MQFVTLIIPKRIKTLYCLTPLFLVIVSVISIPVYSQDNSPYSRYGIGDLVPNTNIPNRAMGGISAGYIDVLSINFSNPASFSNFQAIRETKSKKLVSGRALLDVGINLENRTLKEPATARSFKASNGLFSHVQIGVPIKMNWGLVIGIRPISRISYKIIRTEVLKDPNTGNRIDSAVTLFNGRGGAYLPSIGTGIAILNRVTSKGEQKLSVGLNMGYLFGEKDYSTRRTLINDTVDYYQANYENKTNYGSLYFSGGIQFKTPLSKKVSFVIGANASWGQQLNASQDVLRETFIYDASQGYLRLDSVSDQRNVNGKITLPLTYAVGFTMQKMPVSNQESGWLIGMDFLQENWGDYRFYGNKDAVRDKWELRVGGQFNPVPKRNYFSNVSYRAGFSLGPDYIDIGQKLSMFTASAGFGLPVAISRQAPNQLTIINLAFEYNKRGNNDNILRENLFRISVGLSLSDFWFIKRKYD